MKVATAAEMRELINLDLLHRVSQGDRWDTYAGHHTGRRIRWRTDTDDYASVIGPSAPKVFAWIQNELHTGND